MRLREMTAEMARATAGVWKGIADTVDPAGARPRPPRTGEAAAPTAAPEPGPAAGVEASGDAMLVPIDAWTRIMDQLGNLHEAGQQLAEARERAAKAETENEFLRAQVRDLKQARPTSSRRRPAAPAASTPPDPPASPPAGVDAVVGETRATRARRVVSGWLAP